MKKVSYSIVTLSYWGFTLTDGALRMLVLLHFHQLGYSPLSLAFLFLLYEFFGVITNLLGGWIGSRVGLKSTLYVGLALQITSLIALSLLNPAWSATVAISYITASQALSGIAKDLTKMSSKSAVKLLVPEDSPRAEKQGQKNGSKHPQTKGSGMLFKWVAILTGSKNALKGVGFLLGSVLLTHLGFTHSLWLMAGCLAATLLLALLTLREDMGKSKAKVMFSQLFAKSPEINWLSAARLFLFASRDVWFVVALPVFLKSTLGWSFNQVGSFMAFWIIGYGVVQSIAPRIIKAKHALARAPLWAGVLATVTLLLALAQQLTFYPTATMMIGLCIFGGVFALNSSLHSYLILTFTSRDQVSLNVGFYYMANAWGRLLGTLLSGVIYLIGGLSACLWGSAIMLIIATILTKSLKNCQKKLTSI